MSDVKLNEWRWGKVPELPDDAVLLLGGDKKDGPRRGCSMCVIISRYLSRDSQCRERWYAILSTEPPKMPEPELRLPDGWEVSTETPYPDVGLHLIEVVDREPQWPVRFGLRDIFRIVRPTRRECVEEINRILEGR